MLVEKLQNEDNRQFFRVVPNSPVYQKKLSKRAYIVSVPEKNADEFKTTIEKVPLYNPRVYQNHIEKPKQLKVLCASLFGLMTANLGFAISLLLNLKKPLIAAVTALCAVSGAVWGSKMFSVPNLLW